MTKAVDTAALDTLFRRARTYKSWEARDISDETLRSLYDLLKMAPTAANCQAGRFVFVRSPEAKAKLAPAMSQSNLDQTMTAPVTVIVARDTQFHDKLPKLYPVTDARAWFAGNDAKIATESTFNAALQGAYLILAARSLGLDCGPMSGFDKARVDETFLAGTGWASMMLVNLGYGTAERLRDRLPRLSFDEACRID